LKFNNIFYSVCLTSRAFCRISPSFRFDLLVNFISIPKHVIILYYYTPTITILLCPCPANNYNDGAISLPRRRVDFVIGGCGGPRVRRGRRDDASRVQLGVRGLYIWQSESPRIGHQLREVHPWKLCHTGRGHIPRWI